MVFVGYTEIAHMGQLFMSITQKLHGTNAQICIENEVIRAGNRFRWLTVLEDNFGFAKFVEDNKKAFIEILGDGRHYGEWCGPKINSGEGLTEKSLFLFNWHKFNKIELPPQVFTVPVLYTGKFSYEQITEEMQRLKTNGSRAVPGFMNPEGIVIQVGYNRYKKVFESEETGWKKKKVRVPRVDLVDVTYLLQPIRLEKLLSRDEEFMRNFPNSLPVICKLYVEDLEKENQIMGTDDEIQAIRKSLGKNIFYFVKSIIGEKTNACS